MKLTAQKALDLGDNSVIVRELTVGEIRTWLKELTLESSPDLVTEALFDEVSLSDLARMSDLPLAKMDALRPSELRQLIDAAREVNRDFFTLRAKLTSAARTLAPTTVPTAP